MGSKKSKRGASSHASSRIPGSSSGRRSARKPRLPFLHDWQATRLPMLLALAFLAVMLPLALHYHRIGDHGVETDFYGGLVQESRQIAHGELPVDRFKGPVYGLVLAALSVPVRESFTAAVILSLLSAALVLYFTTKIVLRLFGPHAAILTVLGVAVNAQFVKYSYTASTDMLFNLWMVASAYLLLRREEPDRGSLLLAGLLAGLAYLTRYAGVALLCWAPVAILLILGWRLPWKRRLVITSCFLAAALALIVPWAVYCKLRAGSFVVNDNYLNVVFGMYGDTHTNWEQFWAREAGRFHSFADVALRDPGLFLRRTATNLFVHPFFDMGFKVSEAGEPVQLPRALLSLMHPVLGVLAVPGFVWWILSRPNRRQVAYVALSAAYFAMLLPVFYGSRFSLFLAPAYVLLAALFLLKLPWRRLGRSGGITRGFIIAAVLVFVAIDSGKAIRGDIGNGPMVVLTMRDTLRARHISLEGGAIVVARKPHIAYYLNLQYRAFPDARTTPELMADLSRMNARYLYYGPIEWLVRPQFRFLLDPGKAPPGLVPVLALVTYPTTDPAVLYEVEPTPVPSRSLRESTRRQE
jgi:4-amino-4-deoxy-L-arabinose transferase-like glycosyltransferase